MGEVIVITSGKGGVGKTSAAACIGTGLASIGKKVLIIDMDTGLRNLDVMLGLETRIIYNLVDVLNEKCTLEDALAQSSHYLGLYLLSSSQTKEPSVLSPEQVSELMKQLKEKFDFVLLDCPSGIGYGFQTAIAGAEKALVITTPDVCAVRDADRTIGLLRSKRVSDIRLIVNRIRPDLISKGAMMTVDNITELLPIDLIGKIPEDDQIMLSLSKGEPLSGEESQAEEEYRNICRRLLGEEIPFMEICKKKGMLRRLGNIFKS